MEFTEVASSGTYKITLADTGKCIKNETYAAVNGLFLGTMATNSAQRWQVLRNWNGTYRFCSQVSPYNSVQANEWTTDAFLTTYSCDFNHYDEWTLIPVTKGSASFFDFVLSDINTTYGTETMTDLVYDFAGYNLNSINTNGTTNFTATQGFQALKNSGLFYFSGHGEPG